MFLRRATAPSPRRAQAPKSAKAAGAAARRAAYAVAIGVLAPHCAGCGTPNPRILEATEEARGIPSAELGNEMTEQDKIKALIVAVRTSEHTFVHDDIERSGAATADKLQLLLERDPTGARSAREFIERIAAPDRPHDDRDVVRVSAKDTQPARHWFLVRLAELEGRPPPPPPPEEQRKAEVHARRLRILEALATVERSALTFVVPARPSVIPTKPSKVSSVGPKRKPKRKEYSGPQFADMLRKKWDFLGADIEDLDTFIDEIASDSFASLVRYRVVLADGREEDFGAWLRAEVQGTGVARGGGSEPEGPHDQLAQGGAP
jgi:hypothetical protein